MYNTEIKIIGVHLTKIFSTLMSFFVHRRPYVIDFKQLDHTHTHTQSREEEFYIGC